MRGRDEETGDYLGPSRSQQRREALEVLALGEKLVALTDAQLAKLPVPDSLLPHIRDCRRITAHIAHKRQLAFLAKQMRREDDGTLEAIRDALDEHGETARREVAAMHRVEAWRERLIAEGDAALAALLDEYPSADRQHLRQLVRNAIDERNRNRPPRAFRELYRELRALMMGRSASEEDEPGELEDHDGDEAF
jgi:ribosome-associated protein